MTCPVCHRAFQVQPAGAGAARRPRPWLSFAALGVAGAALVCAVVSLVRPVSDRGVLPADTTPAAGGTSQLALAPLTGRPSHAAEYRRAAHNLPAGIHGSRWAPDRLAKGLPVPSSGGLTGRAPHYDKRAPSEDVVAMQVWMKRLSNAARDEYARRCIALANALSVGLAEREPGGRSIYEDGLYETAYNVAASSSVRVEAAMANKANIRFQPATHVHEIPGRSGLPQTYDAYPAHELRKWSTRAP